jgi:hypothetical protein
VYCTFFAIVMSLLYYIFNFKSVSVVSKLYVWHKTFVQDTSLMLFVLEEMLIIVWSGEKCPSSELSP